MAPSGWQPGKFDIRPLTVYYGFILLIIISSVFRRWTGPILSRKAWCCLALNRRRRVPAWLTLTVGETLMLLCFMSVAATSFYVPWQNMSGAAEPDLPFFQHPTDVRAALVTRCIGHVAEAQIGFALLPVTRNSVWLYGMGAPYESVLRYHRLLGRMVMGLMTLHMAIWWGVWLKEGLFYANAFANDGYMYAVAGQNDPTVPAVEIAWVVMACLVSLQLVRRVNFEMFLYFHYLLLGVVGVIAYHSWFAGGYLVYMLWGPALLYFVDRAMRFVRSRRKARVLELRAMAGATIVRYQLPKVSGKALPGQYAFVCLPKLSALQWHPLSFSSVESRADGTVMVTHHVKDMGPGTWTGQLRVLAEAHAGHRSAGAVDLRSDGPYGIFAGGVDLKRTRVLALVAGGVGATPLMATLRHVLDNRADLAATTPLREVRLLWVVRQPSCLSWFKEVLEQARAADSEAAGDRNAIRFTLVLHATLKDPVMSLKSVDGGGVSGGRLSSTDGGLEETLLPRDSRGRSDSRLLEEAKAELGAYQIGRPNVAAFMDECFRANQRLARAEPRSGSGSATSDAHMCGACAGGTGMSVWTCGPEGLMDAVDCSAAHWPSCCCERSIFFL